jgi:hypothetical protein
MMQSDSESHIPPAEQPDLWTLPDITSVTISRVHYRTPRRHVVTGQVITLDEQVEILVRTDGMIPIRALSPALYIGATEVVENEQVEPDLYRFYLMGTPPEPGEPIALGWVGHPPTQRESYFQYEQPTDTSR